MQRHRLATLTISTTFVFAYCCSAHQLDSFPLMTKQHFYHNYCFQDNRIITKSLIDSLKINKGYIKSHLGRNTNISSHICERSIDSIRFVDVKSNKTRFSLLHCYIVSKEKKDDWYSRCHYKHQNRYSL